MHSYINVKTLYITDRLSKQLSVAVFGILYCSMVSLVETFS